MRYFRRHPAFAVLLLVAHVLAPMGWAQGAVLCIGADGHVAIESAHAEPSCGDACADGENADLDEIGEPDGRCCVDVAAMTCEPVKAREDVSAAEDDVGEAAPAFEGDEFWPALRAPALRVVRTGPPPGAGIVRTVVLRL